jgi:signal transduction histidine kinase
VLSTNSLHRVLSNAVEKGRLQRLVARHRAHLERTRGDLARRNREVEDLYHVLSHDLKAPLNSVSEFLEIVLIGLAGPLQDQQREFLEIARQSCSQMGRCIDDLLDINRLETGRLRLDLTSVEVESFVRRVVISVVPAARGRGVTLSEDIPPGLPRVEIDPNRIGQVLRNLLSNALKFTPQGGRIAVSASVEEDDRVTLRVSDTGRGIPAEQLSSLFQHPGCALADDEGAAGGGGAGLRLCKELVELHGGMLTVQSTLGRGSTFAFTLPPSEASTPVG